MRKPRPTAREYADLRRQTSAHPSRQLALAAEERREDTQEARREREQLVREGMKLLPKGTVEW